MMHPKVKQHRTLAYLRVSTEEQANSHAGLDAQKAALEAEALRRGWAAIEYVEDGGWSAKDLERPGMRKVLEMLAAGEADVLVAAKLDRLSRSVLDFAGLLDRSHREGWSLIVLDLGVDTSSPAGEAMAHVSSAFAQLERRLISQRTAVALQAKIDKGVEVGHPVVVPDETRALIVELRESGMSLRKIAAELRDRGIPTAHGGPWYATTVQGALATARRLEKLRAIKPDFALRVPKP
jgi:DNA invertase Pin-like site-specific DNA recombinase